MRTAAHNILINITGEEEATCHPNQSVTVIGGGPTGGQVIPPTHNSLSGIQGGSVGERYHIPKKIADALQVSTADENNKFLTRADVVESAIVTYGWIDPNGEILVINWLTDFVPGENRTYYEKHGDIQAMLIQTVTTDPEFDDPNKLIPVFDWVMIIGSQPQLIIDNKNKYVVYSIQGRGDVSDKLTQTITFPTIPTLNLNGPDTLLTATASSNLPVTYTSSNTTVAIILNGKIKTLSVGATLITASQSGNITYHPAPSVSQVVTVIDGGVVPTNWNDLNNWNDNNNWTEL